MKRVWILIAIVAIPLVGLAQNRPPAPGGSKNALPGSNEGAYRNQYQPAVPPASMVGSYGGWPGGYGGASTAAGSALNGMASAISAKGDYNLSTSAAAINLTQAQSNEIQNRQQATNTYFEMQATNRAARDAKAGPNLTMDQIAKIAHDAVPKPMAPDQMDPVTGGLNWPSALQEDTFKPERAQLDVLFSKHATYGGLSYADQTKVRQGVNAMFRDLKSQIKSIPPPDYVACRTFLNSLTYAATKTELQ